MTLKQLQTASIATAERAQRRAALAAWDRAVRAFRLWLDAPCPRSGQRSLLADRDWLVAVNASEANPLYLPAHVAEGGAL